ncbi:hypothetical protein BDV12DRAFT_169608 [Aspergillus spectabilis]
MTHGRTAEQKCPWFLSSILVAFGSLKIRVGFQLLVKSSGVGGKEVDLEEMNFL